LKKALELHTMANDGLGQGKDCAWLGGVYKQKGQLHDAKAMFEKAINLTMKAQDSVSEKQCIKDLNTVVTQMNNNNRI
jgi:uncharacterized protein HemY